MYFDINISEKGSYLSCVMNGEFHFSHNRIVKCLYLSVLSYLITVEHMNLISSNLRDQTNLVWTNTCRTQDNIFSRQNNKKVLKKPSLSLFLLLRFSEMGSSWPTPGPIIIGGVPF